MAKLVVTLLKGDRVRLPTGVVYDHTDVHVEDSAFAQSTQSLGAKDTVAKFDVAEGAGSIIVTDLDTNGEKIGTPIRVGFDTLAGTFTPTASVGVSFE